MYVSVYVSVYVCVCLFVTSGGYLDKVSGGGGWEINPFVCKLY